ncbi:lytic transglycosylase domain-containing protein [Rugamonas sp. CCM 8940]|uniref:lytic transglycosylase domain-containing protein n=1 Tax=Rugamonas sp. CCM 8940 TaxID=2765359 RepID=UPI00351C9233
MRAHIRDSAARRAAALLCLALAPAAAQACWEEAGTRYGVNPHLLYAIAKTESGLNPAARNQNKNGSYDVGLMQINSSWLPRLRQFGLDERQLLEPCTSIQVGAWILAQNMQRLGNSWDAIGAYNSSKPALRLKYALRVYKNIPPAVLQQGAGQ